MTTGARRQDYFKRIERVRTHILEHLDEPLDLDRLADIACLSRFHWHRIYRAMTGETIAASVRRLRLDRAAEELAHGERPVAEIAIRAGYAAAPSFTRAFRAAFGTAPAAFRTDGPHAALRHAHEERNAMAFTVQHRTIESAPAFALEHLGPYQTIGETFGRLFSILGAAGLMPEVTGMGGSYTDDPDRVPPAQLKSLAFALVKAPAGDPPEPLISMVPGGGQYAVLTYRGPYSSMQDAYDWLFGTWLPQSGCEPRDAPLLEFNLNSPLTTSPADLLTEICLPIEGDDAG
ncbi:MAG: AraC family transcriptional regulator [Pseudomonadota bacterium]